MNNRVFPCRQAMLLQALLLIVIATPLAAQPFEKVYGARCVDGGYRGVTPVVNCSGGGFISVGSAKPPGGVSNCGKTDAYVVRTDAAGAMIWEYTYDIGQNGTNDTAWSIKELPAGDGFIVIGTTERTMSNLAYTQIFLMQLDCNGAVVWTKTYGPATLPSVANFYARDIIIADVGSAPDFTNPGDFIVAGWATGAVGTINTSLLMRTTRLGFPIWKSLYINPACATGGEQLWALDEAQPDPDPDHFYPGGDIMAAGRSYVTPAFGWQGFALHVNGHTGAFLDAASHGGQGTDEAFWGITGDFAGIPVFNPTWGTFVFAGETRDQNDADIYLVRAGARLSCDWRMTHIIGDPDYDEVALDIVELDNPVFTAPTLFMAITGYRKPIGGTKDVLLSRIYKPFLTSPGFSIYGGPGNDEGRSVHHNANGYIVCGYSESNLEGATPADPSDMYLVHPNYMGQTGCETEAYGIYSWPTESPECIELDPYVELLETTEYTPKTSRNWGNPVCVTPKRNDGVNEQAPQSPAPTLRTFPNPVKPEATVTVDFTSTGAAEITIIVTTTLGETVARLAVPATEGSVRLPIGTRGWAPGAYVIHVSDGAKSESLQVIVGE